ncbi:MAG: SDR family NAD(P)-dependent oxidoreductase [Pseudomonadota bacterium]
MSRSILITGCSSGIGYDAAHTLAKRGWRVFATCRKAEDAERLQREGLESWRLDYADEDNVREGAERALDLTDGRLTALFNNGAYALPGPVEDIPRDGMRAIFEANLFGPHQLITHILPAMRAAGGGRIVNCSSVLGFMAMGYRAPYNATKFALEGLTDTLRREVAGEPLEIILIEPGPIVTPFRANARLAYERWVKPRRAASTHPDARWATLERRLYKEKEGTGRFDLPPSAVTAKLIRALESPKPKSRYFVTTPTYLAEGFRRLLPTSAVDRIVGKG